MGKGSVRRPTNEEAFQNNWEAIFGSKKKKEDRLQTQCLECGEGVYVAMFGLGVICELCGDEKERYVESL